MLFLKHVTASPRAVHKDVYVYVVSSAVKLANLEIGVRIIMHAGEFVFFIHARQLLSMIVAVVKGIVYSDFDTICANGHCYSFGPFVIVKRSRSPLLLSLLSVQPVPIQVFLALKRRRGAASPLFRSVYLLTHTPKRTLNIIYGHYISSNKHLVINGLKCFGCYVETSLGAPTLIS
jgi:hypothetical protein